jgi:hypothetical protein
MENVERADGFWWVRLNPGPRSAALGDGALALWRVLWFFGDSLMTHAPRDGGEFVAMKERVAEWGPYLGKEPETIESLDRKIAEMMALVEDDRPLMSRLWGHDGDTEPKP